MIQQNILLITIAAVTLQIFCSRTLAESFDSESRSQADVSHAVPSQVPECQKKESEFRVPPWARSLNLTPEQRSRLQAIHEKSRTMDEPLYQKEREAEKKMLSLLQSSASIAEIRQQRQILQPLHQQLDDNRFESLMSEREILTPEQLTKVIQFFRKQP